MSQNKMWPETDWRQLRVDEYLKLLTDNCSHVAVWTDALYFVSEANPHGLIRFTRQGGYTQAKDNADVLMYMDIVGGDGKIMETTNLLAAGQLADDFKDALIVCSDLNYMKRKQRGEPDPSNGTT